MQDYLGYGYISGEVCDDTLDMLTTWMIQLITIYRKRALIKPFSWGIEGGLTIMMRGELVQTCPTVK
jgi:hypothetical protein